MVTGEVAVKFFEKTKLPPTVLGEIWQIADTENRGLLTPPGFGIVLRLIGYAQAGRPVSADLALQPGGPLPRFDGIPGPSSPSSPSGNFPGPLRPHHSGGANAGPIRVPPLTPDKVHQYSSLFEESGAQNGMLSGETARQIFERAQLPNEVLGRIWNLADTEQKGSLGLTEFIIAMHLLASYKNGSLRALPQILPAGLYEAAARRGVSRQNTGTRPTSDNVASAIPRQFSGASAQRPSSPLARPPYTALQAGTSPGSDGWAISPQEKAQFDQIYATVDTVNQGFITGEQAVGFFSNSRLPEDVLAQIWDLADINSEGRLNRDEFAVAMYLIKQQRSKRDGRDVLPQTLPPDLIPPSMRRQAPAPSQPTAPAFDNASNATAPKKASDDLFGLDALSSSTGAPSTPPLVPKPTGDSSSYASSTGKSLGKQGSPQTGVFQQQSQPPQHQQSSVFKPFVPSSSFGQTITKVQPQTTGQSQSTPRSQPSAMDDLLGDNDPEVSKKLTSETTELANLSNQVSTLTGQMQQVKSQRISTEQDLSQAQAQKRDFEARLSQLRGAYEQEIRDVKALEDQLASSRNDARKLQQEMAMIGGSHQDLQNQHRQVAEALANDQQENAGLKEKIRQTNEEVKLLKPQLDKIISEARQQKGLVAINKKQLATNEAEREKLRNSINEASIEHDEASRELEESKKSLESQPVNPTPPAAAAAPGTAVASPGGSSMNPFFRSRAPTGGSDRGITSTFAPQNVASPNHNAFDTFFGPSAASETPFAGPPPTSFGSHTPSEPHEAAQEPMLTGQSVKSSEGPVIPTPTESPPPSTTDTAQNIAGEPPAPPQSRQITSSFLPFRSEMQRSDSSSSSVKVVPPASRMGNRNEFDTPTDRETSFLEISESKPAIRNYSGDNGSQITHPPRSSSISAANTPSQLNQSSEPTHSPHQGASPLPPIERSGSREIPGAFPGDATPPVQGQPTMSESSDEAFHSTNTHPDASREARNEPFSVAGEQPRTPVSARQDFDAAFASFDINGKAPEERHGDSTFSVFDGSPAPKNQSEFPPIQEFGADDESDSDSDRGFDDNFTAASPDRKGQDNMKAQPAFPTLAPQSTTQDVHGSGTSTQASGSTLEVGGSSSAATRPPLTSNDTNTSQLPTPGAQQSPPTYDQVASAAPAVPGKRADSNSFPAEYQGLLPSREDPTSPVTSLPVASPAGIASPTNGEKGSNIFGGGTTAEPGTFGQSFGSALSHIQSPMAPGASEAPFAYTHTSSQPQSQSQPQSSPPAQPQVQQQPPVPAKTTFDDFDNEFGDLSEAKEADDKTDDELTNSRKEVFDEFNPVFDSPSGSRTAPQPSSSEAGDSSFHDFESSITGGQGYGPQQIFNQSSQQQPSSTQPQTHDWDAMFAGLDTPENNGIEPSPPANKQTFDGTTPEPAHPQQSQQTYAPPAGPPPSSSNLGAPAKPALGRALSIGTEHDDPILKRLTGMGYPREDSLRALEKFDYNIDKVRATSRNR